MAAQLAAQFLYLANLGEPGWFVDPITVKVMHDRKTAYETSVKVVDLAAQRGECERAQVWGWDDEQDLTGVVVTFEDLTLASEAEAAGMGSAVLSKKHWSYKQQGYVNASSPTHYKCIKDILDHQDIKPPPPPPPPDPNCDDTPWGACWTGCPAADKNFSDPSSCAGGKVNPIPKRPDGTPSSCNRCACNHQNTTCPDTGRTGMDDHPCLSGWYPDPLLDVPTTGIPLVPQGFTQPIYLEVCIPYGQAAGNYSGSLTVAAKSGALFSVPVKLEVWDIDLPRLNDSNAFNTAFNFNSNMSRWYAPGTQSETWWEDWLPFLAHHRVPGDSIYLSAPRPTEEYKMLATSGAKWMGMRDAGISLRPPAQPVAPHHYDDYVQDVIKQLAPTMTAMKSMGMLDKMYVYGFDEMPETYNQSVYQIFGGLKKQWPTLTTMAVLNWETFPSDLPLDIWVDEYADYGKSDSYLIPTAKETLRQSWLASKPNHQFWWYWCIGPNDPLAMNTFVERPAIQARLLYWLTALHAVNGMLYYDVAIWSDQCPSQRPCNPVGRINNTGLTDFNPATWNGNGHSTDGGGANGDGSFTYPGDGGKPLGSIRLSNIADGIEDWELFNKLGASKQSISHAADLITQLVLNETSRVEDPQLLEKVRRQAAHRVMELQRGAQNTL